MTLEDKYRQQAKVFLRRMTEAKLFFDKHKPSIGFVGEYLLRKSLYSLMPQSYGICQGFVTYRREISRQCDIIIYRKGKKSIHKTYGELKIVNSENVVAVIEVKSSITKETYLSTLKAFEQLNALRVTNCFLFVYGQITRKKLSNWLFSYKHPNTSTEQYCVTDSYLYDWSDMEWLPNSVLALESNKYFQTRLLHSTILSPECIFTYEKANEWSEFDSNRSNLKLSINFATSINKYEIALSVQPFEYFEIRCSSSFSI